MVAGVILATLVGTVAARFTTPIGSERQYMFWMNIAYWLAWTGLAPGVFWLTERFPIVAGRRIRAVAAHAVASVGFAGAHVAVVITAALGLRALLFDAPSAEAWAEIGRPSRMQLEWELTMYWALAGLAHAVAFRTEAQERALGAAQLEARLAQAQLQALQHQLQPHFLFNTLHTISALVHRDTHAADRMIERLGGLLRTALTAGDGGAVTLEREIAHARAYLEIEQANMGARLTITVDAPEDTLAAEVPPLLLQPLVENAVRHGIAPRARGGHVRLSARRQEDRLWLCVADDGVGFGAAPGRKGMGIGLENTRQRLEQLHGAAHRFEIGTPPGGGVEIQIEMPFRAASRPIRQEATAWTP
jgi:signal transduction histidine kinase